MLLLGFKFLLRTLIVFLLFLVLYILFAVILSYVPVNRKAKPPKKGKAVYFTSDGIHIDVHVPTVTENYDWYCFLPPDSFKSGDKDYPYVTFGWGDWGFYLETPTWAELKPKTALKAAFVKTPSVMHVSYLTEPPKESNKKIKKIIITDEQLDQLNQHIQESFKVDPNGQPIIIPDRGYHDNDNFYYGEGSYHMFRTCNSWVNEALKKMGVRTSIWSPSSHGVFRHL